jgi:predicted acylesterase/phospholipase RssA
MTATTSTTPGTGPQLRLALTLPGAVSLGAYHGGALAALLVATQRSEGRVVIDAMAGASAGSITAVLAARALLRGADPVVLMRTAWVDGDDLEVLLSSDTRSPLSQEPLRVMAEALLGDPGAPDGPRRQSEPVHLSFSLASLGGLAYRIASLQSDSPVIASTNLDWFDGALGPDDGAAAYAPFAAAALASGANALGFAPVRLDRSADAQGYRDAGVLYFPADGHLWYTDGGTIDNEPFGRTIGLVGDIADDGTAARRYLLVDPQPGVPSHTGTWWGPEQPEWTPTAFKAFGLQASKSSFDDLKRLEKTNSRVTWLGYIEEALDALSDGAKAEVGAAMQAALARITADQGAIRAQLSRAPDPAGVAPAPGSPAADPVRAALEAATGLKGKGVVKVETVSPVVVAPDADPGSAPDPADLLAGEFLGHFGGFLDVRFRQSDFALGYRNMSRWLHEDDKATWFGPAALAAVQQAYDDLGWDAVRFGGASINDLSTRERLRLAHFATHLGHIVVHDLLTKSDTADGSDD